MRLINTTTLEFEEFYDEAEVRYAILSHRWETEEVTFQDMLSNPRVAEKKGYRKIRKLCAKAKEQDLAYAWIDTCCIDKSSSAELQEAINSMFRWYKNAVICYAFLSDWTTDSTQRSANRKAFHRSQWFRRGWTLQELIAPQHVQFFDSRWVLQGTRASLYDAIADATRIPRELLQSGGCQLSKYTIAQKMSWANGRQTTRIEDRAYSLFGLFDVNMPMLYGEGKKAFLRLQEEIFRKTSDRSILAWTGLQEEYGNVFAPSPDNFSTTFTWGSFLRASSKGTQAVTNEGIEIGLELIPWRPNMYLAILHHSAQDRVYGIFLRPVEDYSENAYIRVSGEDEDVFHGICNLYHRKDTYRPRYIRTKLLRASPLSLVKSSIVSAPDFELEIPELNIQSRHKGRAGLVDIIELPYYREVHRVSRVLLGFGFTWCPTIVLEMEGDLMVESEDIDRSDVSQKDLYSISCFEPTGWLPIGLLQKTRPGIPSRSWYWPLHLEAKYDVDLVYQIEIHLGLVEAEVSRCILLTVARCEGNSVWKIILTDLRIPSFEAKVGYSSWAPVQDGRWITPRAYNGFGTFYHEHKIEEYTSAFKHKKPQPDQPDLSCTIGQCYCVET